MGAVAVGLLGAAVVVYAYVVGSCRGEHETWAFSLLWPVWLVRFVAVSGWLWLDPAGRWHQFRTGEVVLDLDADSKYEIEFRVGGRRRRWWRPRLRRGHRTCDERWPG